MERAFARQHYLDTTTKNRLRGWFPSLLPRHGAVVGTAALILTVVALAVLVRAWQTCGFAECPSVERLTTYQPGGASLLLDRYGEPFASLSPIQREVVSLRSLPPVVAQAFLAVEDQRFLQHHGVDWRRVVGATLANLRAGSFREGFSTITMQLARNVFPEKIQAEERTAARKLREIKVAREIEKKFGKQEILELYLNHIYFGNGAHGIEAASQYYFRRPAAQLTLPQAALLATLPKAPSHYDPRRHPAAARARRDLVLALMEQQERVSADQAKQAQASPLGVSATPPLRKHKPEFAPYFVEEVRRVLDQQFGALPDAEPLRIWTTLDVSAQRTAEQALATQLLAIERGKFGSFTGSLYAANKKSTEEGATYLQGALVVLGVENGDVLAWIGGRDFQHSQFDRVTRSQRQVGSTFKPFVYAAALTHGYALSQPVSDEPLRMKMANGQVWEPRNFADQYDGWVTIRDALVRSKNVATVRLANDLGYEKITELAGRVGIEGVAAEHLSMPLGTVGVSPLALTSAYTAFAGLGEMVTPRLILRIESPKGELLWESKPARRRVLDPGVAFLVNDMLRDVAEWGSGKAVRQFGFQGPVAGKTGTTNEGTDAWFVGYTPGVVAGVWIGFDQPRAITKRATGGTLAAPVWGQLIAHLYEGKKPSTPWRLPRNVVTWPIDPASGLILAPGCSPLYGRELRELFLAGMEPATVCPKQEPIPRDGFYTARRDRDPDGAEAHLATREELAARQAREARRAAQEWADDESEHAMPDAPWAPADERRGDDPEQRFAATPATREAEPPVG